MPSLLHVQFDYRRALFACLLFIKCSFHKQYIAAHCSWPAHRYVTDRLVKQTLVCTGKLRDTLTSMLALTSTAAAAGGWFALPTLYWKTGGSPLKNAEFESEDNTSCCWIYVIQYSHWSVLAAVGLVIAAVVDLLAIVIFVVVNYSGTSSRNTCNVTTNTILLVPHPWTSEVTCLFWMVNHLSISLYNFYIIFFLYNVIFER